MKPMNVVIKDGFNNSADMRGIPDLLLCPHRTILHPTAHTSLSAESALQQEPPTARITTARITDCKLNTCEEIIYSVSLGYKA